MCDAPELTHEDEAILDRIHAELAAERAKLPADVRAASLRRCGGVARKRAVIGSSERPPATTRASSRTESPDEAPFYFLPMNTS